MFQNLDIQYTVGLATDVPIDLISVGCDNTDGLHGFLDVINFLNDQPTIPTVLSTSYAFDENTVPQSLAKYVFCHHFYGMNVIDDYLTPENVKEVLDPVPDIILDCIDDVKAKLALMLHCRFNKIPLIVSGGAGGKLDPLKIRVADLSKTEQDPMLAKLRAQLRSKGICKKPKEKFGITCVYSIDNPFSSADVCPTSLGQSPHLSPGQSGALFNPGSGLRCGGYGSAVVVTSSFAMVAVAEVLKKLDKMRA